jgi:hypothetical protein
MAPGASDGDVSFAQHWRAPSYSWNRPLAKWTQEKLRVIVALLVVSMDFPSTPSCDKEITARD